MKFLGWLLRTVFFVIFLVPRILLWMLFSRQFKDRVIYFSLSPRSSRLPAVGGEHPRPQMTVTSPLFGGGFYAASRLFVVEARGEGGGRVLKAADKQIIAGGGNGGLSGGLLLRLGHLRVFPLFSVDGGGGGITIKDAMPDTPPSTSEPTPNPYASYGSGGVRRWTGFGVEYRLGGRVGLIVGLRVGGEQAFFGGASDLVVRFVIGVGYFGSHTRAKSKNDTPDVTR